jgi:hypothetical protein
MAFGACGCLIALAALALALLSSGDAHGVELGPLNAVDVPVPTPADSLVDTVDQQLTVSPAPADLQPLGSVVEPVGAVVDPVVEPVLGTAGSDVEPVLGTVEPVVEPVVDPVVSTVGPVVEPVLEPVVEPVVDPMLGIEPVVEPVVDPVLDTITPVDEQITPVDEQIIPVLPTSELLAPVLGGVDGVQPFATSDQTFLAMPQRPPRAFAGLGPAVSANIAADVPVGSSNPPVGPSSPSPANRGSPVLPQAMRSSTSTSTSSDTAHGLQLLLYVIAGALAAFCLTRGRRVLPFGAVMPRFALVSSIERPG